MTQPTKTATTYYLVSDTDTLSHRVDVQCTVVREIAANAVHGSVRTDTAIIAVAADDDQPQIGDRIPLRRHRTVTQSIQSPLVMGDATWMPDSDDRLCTWRSGSATVSYTGSAWEASVGSWRRDYSTRDAAIEEATRRAS